MILLILYVFVISYCSFFSFFRSESHETRYRSSNLIQIVIILNLVLELSLYFLNLFKISSFYCIPSFFHFNDEFRIVICKIKEFDFGLKTFPVAFLFFFCIMKVFFIKSFISLTRHCRKPFLHNVSDIYSQLGKLRQWI